MWPTTVSLSSPYPAIYCQHFLPKKRTTEGLRPIPSDCHSSFKPPVVREGNPFEGVGSPVCPWEPKCTLVFSGPFPRFVFFQVTRVTAARIRLQDWFFYRKKNAWYS